MVTIDDIKEALIAEGFDIGGKNSDDSRELEWTAFKVLYEVSHHFFYSEDQNNTYLNIIPLNNGYRDFFRAIICGWDKDNVTWFHFTIDDIELVNLMPMLPRITKTLIAALQAAAVEWNK